MHSKARRFVCAAEQEGLDLPCFDNVDLHACGITQQMLALHSLTTCPHVLRYTTKQQAVVSERPALLQCGAECE